MWIKIIRISVGPSLNIIKNDFSENCRVFKVTVLNSVQKGNMLRSIICTFITVWCLDSWFKYIVHFEGVHLVTLHKIQKKISISFVQTHITETEFKSYLVKRYQVDLFQVLITFTPLKPSLDFGNAFCLVASRLHF